MFVTSNFWSRPPLCHTNPGDGSAFGVVRSVRTLNDVYLTASLPDFAYTFEARRQLRHIFFVKKLPTKTKLNETKIQNFVYFGSHAHPGVL